MGDAVINKTYTVDCISKKKKRNNGERAKYYVENNHPAILENQPLQFNDELIRQMLQCVVVESKDRIKVIFTDGTEINQPIQRG